MLPICGVVRIVVIGLVHWFALRPLLDLDGASSARRRRRAVPAGRVAPWTLVVGAVTGSYPYPFLDVGARGSGAVPVASAAVTALFVVVSALVVLLDRVLSPAPRGVRRPPYDGREPPARRPEPTS